MTSQQMPLMENDSTSTTGVTNTRRKSGRAVKVPDKFIPDLPSSQHDSTSAKRKRVARDVEDDASDSEEDDESDESDSESEMEEVREIKKKPKTVTKPATKKPKVNGATLHEKGPAVKLPNRPKKARKVIITDRNAEGLYGKCA